MSVRASMMPPRSCSGAAYAIVPMKMLGSVSWMSLMSATDANPKSITL